MIKALHQDAVKKAQTSSAALSLFALVISAGVEYYSSDSIASFRVAVIALNTTLVAAVIGIGAVWIKRFDPHAILTLKVASGAVILALLLSAYQSIVNQNEVGFRALALLASLVCIGAVLLISRRRKGKPMIGRKASAQRKLVPVQSDVGVGMHLKYEDLVIPKLRWEDDFIGMEDLQVKVREATYSITKGWKDYSAGITDSIKSPNGILLTGDPGNGKTFIGELIAGSFQIPFFNMVIADFSSQWVGESNKALAIAFEFVKRNSPCVLFIDELDSFVSSRSSRGSGNAADQQSVQMVNTFLTELVEIRKFPVLVVAASNHVDKIDPAIAREGRFDFKIHVENPDHKARTHLLMTSLARTVPGAEIDAAEVKAAAKKFNGFNAKRVIAIGERVPNVLRKLKTNVVGRDVLIAALRDIQGTKGRIPEDALALSEIVLTSDTREQVENLLADFKMVDRLDEFGGDIVRGVLFYGPPGTGKTTVAKTIAKESGWAFLSTTGPDLAADPKLLEDIYSKAKSLRPCVIFIDEADQVLRDRTRSHYAELTNKLLTIMEGVDDPVKDVVFIAATNHPNEIDSALLRTGRFTGKVEFDSPGDKELETLVRLWVEKRKNKVRVEDLGNVIAMLKNGGYSQANAQGVLQTALNNAIRGGSICDEKAVIQAEHIRKALNFIKTV
jgi:transitional endoplasmic reticulum ATPase